MLSCVSDVRPGRDVGPDAHTVHYSDGGTKGGAASEQERLLARTAPDGFEAGAHPSRVRRDDGSYPARADGSEHDMDSQRFSGQVAVVTGSTAEPSIGRACAFRLAREGASVVVNGRHEERVRATETALRAEGFAAVGVTGSMDRDDMVSMLVDRAVDAFGRIDLVVSTLGGAPHPRPFDAISEEQLLETFRLNTWPAVALIRAAMDRGLGEHDGSVVVISSGSPRKTTSAMVSYASAKAALNAMTRTIAADLAGRVRVNAVSPGLVRTSATRPIWDADGGQAAGAHLPVGRLTEAEDVAAAVCFLLSDDARQITGITLDVDGGNHLGSGWTPIH